MSLPAQLQSYLEGPAELAQARALVYDRGLGLTLVGALAEQRLRSHLEALGEVASDKAVRKAARAAAYKLKSAGVTGGVEHEAKVDLSLKIEGDHIAGATAAGFDGRLWLLLPSLPGVGGAEIDLREQRQPPSIATFETLSVGRVRRFQAELTLDKVSQPLVLVGLDLATRLVAIVHEALLLSGKPMPPTMNDVMAWHKRALALGADPARASARATLGPAGRPLPDDLIELLAAHPKLGFLAAPASAFDSIDADFRELLHGDVASAKAAFLERGQALVAQAASAWWASPHGRALAALWLDATADVLMADGDTDSAKIALAAGDDMLAWEGAALAQPLIARAFRGAVDLEAAWMHREAHARGEAHHS